jgi:hypothetical protein
MIVFSGIVLLRRLARKKVKIWRAWFDERGMAALLLLKHYLNYLNVSDEQLIERLNTDLALQYFQFSGKAQIK